MNDHTEASISAAIAKTWGNVSSQGQGVRYVVAFQVNNGAGFSFGRTLDAVVFDTWPSKGLSLAGIEIKCSKADLRRELQTPEKAADFTAYLDTFSIACPKEVLEGMRDLIPGRWGIYTPTEDGTLRTVRKPLYLHEPERDRSVMNRSVVAAFTRALVQRSLSSEARDLAFSEGYRSGQSSKASELQQAERVAEQVAAFEEASGVHISTYRGGRVGEAVKFIIDGGLETKFGYSPDLRAMGRKLLKLADELDALRDSMAEGVTP